MKNLVTSKELSIKLKKAGVEQFSKFCYLETGELFYKLDRAMLSMQSQTLIKKSYFLDNEKWYAAFLAEELFEKLPRTISDVDIDDRYFLGIRKDTENSWTISYEYSNTSCKAFNCESLAEAAGQMLLYLIDNKLINYDSTKSRK